MTITGDGGVAGDFEERRRVWRHQHVDVISAAAAVVAAAAEVRSERLERHDLDGAIGVLFVCLLLPLSLACPHLFLSSMIFFLCPEA